MKEKLTARSFDKLTLEPGKYWIGDPCYCYNDSEWGDFCDKLHKHSGPVVMTFNRTNFFVCGTAYGDGCYELKKNGTVIGNCGVDAGLLSIIPARLVKLWEPEEQHNPDFGGVFIDLKNAAEVEANEDGNFSFGEFSMQTDGEDQDPDEEYA